MQSSWQVVEVGHDAVGFCFDVSQQLKLCPPFFAGVSSILIELRFSVFYLNISNFSLADCQVLLIRLRYLISGILLFFLPFLIIITDGQYPRGFRWAEFGLLVLLY